MWGEPCDPLLAGPFLLTSFTCLYFNQERHHVHLSVQRSCSWGTPAVLQWIRNDDGYICYLWRTSLCVHALPVQLPLRLPYSAQQTLKNMKWHRANGTAECQLPLLQAMLGYLFKMHKINTNSTACLSIYMDVSSDKQTHRSKKSIKESWPSLPSISW